MQILTLHLSQRLTTSPVSSPVPFVKEYLFTIWFYISAYLATLLY